jgi:iron uptake system component EfeO
VTSRSRLALAGLFSLSVAACGSAAPIASGPVAVTVSDAGCTPTTATVPSGEVTFVITNSGPESGEFEVVLAGERVVDEAENIVPGFVVNLKTRLDGGTYELICYTKTAPRGALTVTGGPAPTRPASAVVDAARLAAIVAEYRTYVLGEAADLITVIDTFTAAIDAGDLEAAKTAYGPSRVPWERIEPVAELFADLDPKLDAREDDYELGVDDPEFTGYHRLEKALWVDGTTDGLSALTTTMRADVADLRARLETLEIEPRVMARGAGELIDEVAQSKMTGEEDRYSKLDLWSIDPNLEGSAKIVDLLRPVLTELDKAYVTALDGAYASVEGIIAKYGDQATGFQTFDSMSAADLKALQAGLASLSELLSELPGRLGLEA